MALASYQSFSLCHQDMHDYCREVPRVGRRAHSTSFIRPDTPRAALALTQVGHIGHQLPVADRETPSLVQESSPLTAELAGQPDHTPVDMSRPEPAFSKALGHRFV